MVDVRAVIGNSNTLKTSTIRALTGVGRREAGWWVAFQAGPSPIKTYVHPQGLQERGVSPQQFINAVRREGVKQVIVALRYNRARGQPDALSYLKAFRRANWNVVAHAVLGRSAIIPGYTGLVIPNASDGNVAQLPSNEVARQVRADWGML